MERPSPRSNARLPVQLTFEGSPTSVRGVTENISESGALVRSPVIRPPGTSVQMGFGEFEAKGEIVWAEQTDEGAFLGMRLVSMGWDGWKRIRAFFESSDGPDG